MQCLLHVVVYWFLSYNPVFTDHFLNSGPDGAVGPVYVPLYRSNNN